MRDVQIGHNMTIKAVEHMFTGSTIKYSDPYDSSKTILGKWIVQNTGNNDSDKFAGPFPISYARPMEASTAIAASLPHVVDIGDNTHWVFLAEVSAATATRRVVCYRFNTATQVWSWRGFITLTYPIGGAHTVRALRVQRHLYTTGTVAVSGTAVTGTSTAWQTARYAVGARIGFGSTDPNAITSWYYITAIGSDTSITLSATAGTISAGTAFVIEELRIITLTTNTTLTNGGLFVAKGVNYDDFVVGGTTIAAAITTDNVKAVYWLADASTILNTIAGGMDLGTASNTSQIVYVTNADAAATLRIYKYDIRVALSGLSAGKSTSAFLYRTGAQPVAGSISQISGAILATLNHGPGLGISCLYVATTSRILRCPESAILDGAVSYVADNMVEIPPGGSSTFAVGSLMSNINYFSDADKLVIASAATTKNYVTKYQTTIEPFERWFSSNTLAQTISRSSDIPIYPHNSLAYTIAISNGIIYMSQYSSTGTNAAIFALPLSTDWDYAATTNGRLITPKMNAYNCLNFSRVYVLHEDVIGSSVAFSLPLEPWRIYYRTLGIDDNSGSWSLISQTGDLSVVGKSSEIQFMFEFRILGPFMLPSRIRGLYFTYREDVTDSHFQNSKFYSSSVNKKFAWRFSTAFGTTVPTLTVRLYDSDLQKLILTDTTVASSYGLWEKSTNDGVSWSSYNTSDKANETTYIRYTPSSIPSNITVQAILTQ